jgi:hypothetical protein
MFVMNYYIFYFSKNITLNFFTDRTNSIFLILIGFSSESMNEYSEESDIDRDGTTTIEDDPNKLWCFCRKPHNNE